VEVALDAPRWKRPIDYYLLWGAVIGLIIANYLLVTTLLDTQKKVTAQVADAAFTAAEAMGGMTNMAIDYPVEIREAIPISLTIRYSDTVVVPISYTLPINTNVSVPLRTPLGTFPINVPIALNVPIHLTPTVPLDLAVPVSLTVPIAIDVPIHVDLSTTPLGEGLSNAQAYLYDIASDLSGGTIIVPTTTVTVTAPALTPTRRAPTPTPN
jgi:hypothetical protein